MCFNEQVLRSLVLSKTSPNRCTGNLKTELVDDFFMCKLFCFGLQERKEFEKQIKSRPGRSEKPLTADEMSVFYKKFLDKYWKTHFWYNVEWYKNNITLLILAFRVEMNRFKNKLINK